MGRPKPTMTPEEEAQWMSGMDVSIPTPPRKPKRVTRARWSLEELWEEVAIFNSQGLRDSAEFLLWLEKRQ